MIRSAHRTMPKMLRRWTFVFLGVLISLITSMGHAQNELRLRAPAGMSRPIMIRPTPRVPPVAPPGTAALVSYNQPVTPTPPATPTPSVPPAPPEPIPAYPNMVPVGTIGPAPMIPHTAAADVCPRCGVQCGRCGCGPKHWNAESVIPWEMLAQGEYVGPARTSHVAQYRLRVDDLIQFVYRLDGKPSANAYRLEVGDRLQIESLGEKDLDREVVIQPDGKITVRLLGEVVAAGRTMEDLRADLEQQYKQFVNDPAISINPLQINTTATELIATVDRRYGLGGQAQVVRVTPSGTVQLPAIGSVPAQGLTLGELKLEVEQRYSQFVSGMEVTPILNERAPRYVFIVGEVRNPGRFTLEGPTTAMQGIALAGSWNVGAYLKHVIVFRRDENWRLMATRLDLRGALDGRRPCPADEIWLRDSDIVVVPQSPVLRADNFIELVFTRGIYGVIPLNFSVNFAKLSTL